MKYFNLILVLIKYISYNYNKTKFPPYLNNIIKSVIIGRIQKIRKPYLIACLIGAWIAKNSNYKKVVLIEFGVANGSGLSELILISKIIKNNLNISTRVIGFDSNKGLPHPKNYKDHPEIWQKGDFKISKKNKIKFKKYIIEGNLSNTLKNFKTEKDEKIIFMSVDVDYYSSTKLILSWVKKNVKHLMGSTPVYFDDVFNNFFYSKFSGELLAINEFNKENKTLKIECKDRDLKIFTIQNFKDPYRNGYQKPLYKMEIFSNILKSFLF